MFPRLRGAWGPRRMAFAVIPAALGALLFLAGDRPSTGTSRLEATQGIAPVPLPGDQTPDTTGPPADTAPATAAPDGAPTAVGLLGEAVAAALAADPEAAAASDTAGAGPATTSGTPTAGPAGTNAFTAPATSESSSTPRASSGETSTPATTNTSTTAAAPPTTTTTAAPRSGPVRVPGVEAEVVPLTNADRNANGLGSLSRSGCLDAVASRYAEQLARSGVLAHTPGASAAVSECRPNSAWGDNVGTSLPCSSAVLEERWMASPSHRRNILTGEFQYIGVGAWTDTTGACWVQVLFSS